MSASSRKVILARLTVSLLVVVAVYSIVFRPALEEIRLCEDVPQLVSVEGLALRGLPENRFIELAGAKVAPNDDESVSYSENGQYTYVSLKVGDSNSDSRPVIARLSGKLDAKSISFVFSSDQQLGFVYHPEAILIPGIATEREEIGKWLGSDVERLLVVDLLDAPPKRWKSWKLWVSLPVMLYAAGFGLLIGITRCIHSSRAAFYFALFFLAIFGGIVYGWLSLPRDAAIWRPVLSVVNGTIAIYSGVGAALALCRAATVFLCEENKASTEIPSGEGPREVPPFQATPQGFAIRDGADILEFADHDVLGVGILMETNEVEDGILCQRVVRLRVREGNGSDVLRITDVVKVGDSDVMHDFLRRLTQGMSRRYESEISSGGSLRGAGWELNRISFVIQRGDSSETVGIQEIAQADWVSNEYCIWKTNREQAVVRLPAESENVHILAAVLPKLANQQQSIEGEHGLGRQFFEIRSKSGLGSQLLGAIGKDKTTEQVRSLGCYENGVVIETLDDALRLGILEIQGLAVSHEKGLICLDLWSVYTDRPFRLRVSQNERQLADRLQYFEEHLAQRLSTAALKDLVATGEFRWTSDLRICLDGLHELLDNGQERVHGLGGISSLQSSGSHILIPSGKREDGPLSVPRSARNALVGMYALKGLKDVYSDTCTEFRLPPKEPSTPE
ncbi:MAG: hypothetical protein KDA80_03545 [Planctomycetaceae bacterium]|nr:hypothetical protein [Planctomycetaceae bacterium]